MVMSAMQQQPQVIYGPNGETARWNGREYVVESSAPASPPPAPSLIIPMQTPADRRAEQDQAWQAEDRAYRRQRDVVTDARAESREERAIAAAERQANQLTEGQSKALQYGTMMRGAEADYQAARAAGYNPASFRNQAAEWAGLVPWDGDYFGRLIRDDQSDRGFQAERRWAEANLRQLTGAAASDPEISRVQTINFDRGNDELADQRFRTRQDTYGATRLAAGPAADRLPADYPQAPLPAYDGPAGFNVEGEVRVRPDGSSYTVVNSQNLAPEDTPESLRAQGYEQGPDGHWFRNIAPGSLPPDDGGSPPATPSPPSGGGAPGDAERGAALLRQTAFQRGAMEQLPGAKELIAGIAGMFDPLRDAGDYMQAQRALAQYDRENNTVERNMGGLAGATGAVVTPFGAPVRVFRGATMAGRAGNRALGGGLAGGLWGFGQGEGNGLQRVDDAAKGAALGAGAGVAAPVVAQQAGRVANALAPVVRTPARLAARLGEALNVPGATRVREALTPNALNAGAERFADRMGRDRVNALAPALAERRANGLDEATLVDVLDDGSIGRLRALATRDTSARDQAVRFAEGRRANLPSRVSRIAREEISGDTRPALDIIDTQRTVRRNNASAIDQFGNDVVPVNDDLILALRSDFVRPHLQAAARRAQGATDPAEREAAARLTRLSEMALDDPSALRLTVREAQDVSRALNDAATAAFRAGSADGPVLANLATTIRGAARDNSAGYAGWLQKYGEDSDLIEAATRGRNFVSVSRDPVNARSTEAFVRGVEEAPEAALPIQQAVSREAVEVASSNPAGARSTLEAFASDRDQARRAAAIGVDPARLAARSRTELEALTRAQRASPRIGSESSTNLQDAADAGGLVVRAARNPTALVGAGAEWVINRVTSRGFSNQQAQAIVEAAIDPARTDELIAMLSERMTRREARNLTRAIRYQLTTGPQSGRQER